MQQVQKQTQRLIMTPQMQQSIKLLQMNTIELETLTQQELLENPFLEVAEEDTEAPPSESTPMEAASLEAPAADSLSAGDDAPSDADRTEEVVSATSQTDDLIRLADDGFEDLADPLTLEDQPERFGDVDVDWSETFSDDSPTDAGQTPSGEADWTEIFDNAASRTYSPPSNDEDERSFEETTAGGTSLYEKLLWQVRVSSLTGTDAEIAQYLIGCIDERGYLQTQSPVDECAARFRVPAERVERILQSLDGRPAPHAFLTEREAYVRENFAEEDVQIGLDLAGYLVAMDGRLGSVPWRRKPTLEACAEHFDVDRERVERVLGVIQEFDPVGVGARNLPECLRLQLAAQGRLTPLGEIVLREHWAELLKKQFRPIARALKAEESTIEAIFHSVRNLNPAPGLTFSKEQPLYITPDVYVREVDGRFVTYLNEGEVAHLRINNTYRDILLRDKKGSNQEEREYAIDKFRAAVMFIKNVEKRRNTVLRVTEAIMEHQRGFLERGVEALRPLALSEIAEKVSMHESTISRVTSSKYVDTPQGLFELKYFFSSAIESADGAATSSRSIRQKIGELIAAENPQHPLSDDKIAKVLMAKGFSIARRTVAKYREQLKILPTNLRRKS
jgi:RNA polymerase sigma-54 factor